MKRIGFSITSIILIIVYSPIVIIVFQSFFKLHRGKIKWDSFSFDAYTSLIENSEIIQAIARSLIVGGLAALSAVAVAFLLSLALLTLASPKLNRVAEFVVYLPFLMPPVVVGLALLIAFREIEFDRSLVTVGIGHLIFVQAIAFSIVFARMRSLSKSQVEAAAEMGASRLRTAVEIVLPQMGSALLAAGLIAFALSLDETMITLFIVGDAPTMPVRLYGMMRVGFAPEVNALASIMLLLAVACATTVVARTSTRRDTE